MFGFLTTPVQLAMLWFILFLTEGLCCTECVMKSNFAKIGVS
jgi:hypothetical protein